MNLKLVKSIYLKKWTIRYRNILLNDLTILILFNFDNKVYRMAWIVRNSDNKGDIWVEAFRREVDAIFSRSVRGGRIIRGFFKAAPEEV